MSRKFRSINIMGQNDCEILSLSYPVDSLNCSSPQTSTGFIWIGAGVASQMAPLLEASLEGGLKGLPRNFCTELPQLHLSV